MKIKRTKKKRCNRTKIAHRKKGQHSKIMKYDFKSKSN